MESQLVQAANVAGGAARPKLLISPLEGEMSGRTEGGGKERDLDHHDAGYSHELG